jgi:tetratricopeptide (TPR) repeat protein
MAHAFSILMVAGCCIHAWQHWHGLFGRGNPIVRREFRLWLLKGFAGPWLLWVLLNAGLLPGFPPLLLEAASAVGLKNRLLAAGIVALQALFVIGFVWASMTYAWLIALVWPRVEEEYRGQLFSAVLTWTLLLLPVGILWTFMGGWAYAGFGAALWLAPITHYTVPLISPHKRPPTYARALVRVNLGKYSEAESEVLRELENCEDDFDGWMLLADLYANHFHDLPAADRAVRDLCEQPNVNPSQVSVALNRLADWHLKLGEDPAAARVALDCICQKLPGTHMAKMAGLRINRLPATAEELRAQQRGRTLHLPSVTEDPAAAKPDAGPLISKDEALARANECVEKLIRNPNAVAERETLATLYADRLFQADLGIEQLELLLGMPAQPDSKVAEWLARLAAWQLRYRGDRSAARGLWDRLVRDYPQTPEAFDAQRRIVLMDVEQKLRRARVASPG